MKTRLPVVSLLMAAAFLNSCSENTSKEAPTQKFIETSYMDSSVNPGDNFFLYINGGWLKTAVIPSTESGVGSFLDLRNKTREALHSLLEDATKSNAATGTIEQKVGDFYLSGMDSATIEKRGYDPVKPTLQKINDINNTQELMNYVAEQQKELSGVMFNAFVGADEKNSAKNIQNR